MTELNPHSKPDPTACPKTFCFHWVPKGGLYAPGKHKSRNDAMKRLIKAEEGKCVCSWGTCSRLDPQSKKDLYEPVEPELEKHGLPWFYFIAGPDNVAEGSRAKYLQDSNDWWK